MKRLSLAGASGHSAILIGESIGKLASYSDSKKNVIITDAIVHSLHGKSFPSWPVIQIGTGEESKTLETVEHIYEAFLQQEVDRSSFVVAIGGGIVCDVAGFAASTFMRGLPFGFVPTTLLAQVDASVGGKNGVNFKGYKNLVGTFTQPRFVLCDFEVLKTVPADEQKNGFAEVIKHGAIGNPGLFSYLETDWEKTLNLTPDAIERIVYESIVLKSGIVAQDERERGVRRLLNFGHTIGHGLEKVTGLRHGEAVSVGMVVAARLSVLKGMLSYMDAGRLRELLVRFGLPVHASVDPELLMDAMRKDKKREDGLIHFILLEGIGKAKVTPVRIDEFKEVISDLRQHR